MITLACPGCGRDLKVQEERAGQRVHCPHCARPIPVPPSLTGVAASALGSGADVAGPTQGSSAEPVPETVAGAMPSAPAPSGLPSAPAELTEFLTPPQEPGEIGRLGVYRVLQVLGAGGMGVVFQAEDMTLKRRVALKAMLPALAASDTARQRFLREAQTAASIEHDHIVTIFQVGEDRGVLFLAMPFLKGESLEDRLRRERRLPLAEVLRIGRETAAGLAAAHERGLIHRDIKPANLWLEGSQARVKILDFGLARASSDAHLTAQGAILGTPAYMSPEQARGEPASERSDLFSLGCVLYRMCTGELPFKGRDTISTLVAVTTEAPRPPRELNPEIPREVADLVMGLLAKDPAQRPPAAAAVVEAIRKLEEDRTMVLSATLTPQKAEGRRQKAEGRSSLLVFCLLLCAFCLLLGGAGYLLYSHREEPSTGKDHGVSPVPPSPAEVPARCLLDALRREDIPPDLLARAGGGDPRKAPPELVAVYRDDQTSKMAGFSCLAISGDGRWLALGTRTGRVRMADLAARTESVIELQGRSLLGEMCFGPDSRVLAACSRRVALCRLQGDSTWRESDPDLGSGREAAFSPDGKLLATGYAGNREPEGFFKLFQVDPVRKLDLPEKILHRVGHLVFHPDGRSILLGGSNGKSSLHLLDVKTRRVVRDFPPDDRAHNSGRGPTSLSFTPDGRVLSSTFPINGGQVVLWDVPTGKVLQILPCAHRAYRAAFSPDGTSLAACLADGTIRFWNGLARAPGEAVQETRKIAVNRNLSREEKTAQGNGRVFRVVWSPEGRHLLTLNSDNTVYVLRLAPAPDKAKEP